ncbi:hypothetical protein SBI67_10930 [Mycolicibacterium sp. 120266]|jgi:hypothetical protein|uniref:hypothetical protein n=1 Tax=Mycolicibacterium sp. 120266 TaxID=3090601 RepID=UPI00299DCEA9|nr:hypothetical protein [Mycolicibacterium sp. 120266]MDX1872637.1 hypothetical protein [Mycolicibacterium sp. 120266]
MRITHTAAVAIAAAALAIAAAPQAGADVDVVQHAGHAEVVATPGPAADHAARLQTPFGGAPVLAFHH